MQLTQKKALYGSIGGALIAVLLASGYLANQKRKLLSWSEPVTVLIATKDTLANVQIDESMVEESIVPKKFAQPGSLAKLDFAVGRVTVAPLKKGEQVADTKLVSLGPDSGLAVRIPAGKRAVTVAVDDVTGVAGLIKPNNFIDVLATFDFGSDASAKVYTHTILEAVQILAVGGDLGSGNIVESMQKKSGKALLGAAMGDAIGGSRKKTVTMALSLSDAQKVILAQETGAITLVLRPQWEKAEPLGLDPATPASVTGIRDLVRAKSRPIYREYRGR